MLRSLLQSQGMDVGRRAGGLGSDLTLADVENPPAPAFLQERRLCHRDSHFPVFLQLL